MPPWPAALIPPGIALAQREGVRMRLVGEARMSAEAAERWLQAWEAAGRPGDAFGWIQLQRAAGRRLPEA